MMTCMKLPLHTALLILVLSFLAGCSSSQPTQFYTLSSLVPKGTEIERSKTWIGVEPISLPGYLDRPHVVTRNGANQLTIAEFEQWAEPLEAAFQRVLIENLRNNLGTDQIVLLPSRRDITIDHQVEMDIARFDADSTGEVVLDLRWRIFNNRGDVMQDNGRSNCSRRSGAPPNYRPIVEAMSQCLGAASDEIARALSAL